MAITDAQKVDLLYKKIGFGVAKTDTSAFKSPSNEANASPILTRGDTIWVESGLIPGTKPTGNTSVLRLYQETLSSAVECVLDTTVSGTNRTWLTNYNDWIPSEFGSSYQVKVYAAPAGNTSPETYGTQLFADGSGNSDAWYFDYQAGILNFPDTNVPTAVTGKRIYIVGARYVGLKGVGTLANLNIGNLAVDSISINNAAILGGYLSNIANITAITANLESLYSTIINTTTANISTGYVENFSSGNAVINGGYVTSLSNITATTGNVQSWYAENLNSTSANVTNFYSSNVLVVGGNVSNTDAQINNFSTANALVSGGIIYNVDVQANNFSTANALVSGGIIYNVDVQANNFSTANALITGGDISDVNLSTSNALITGGDISDVNVQANNFSTANALVSGGIIYNVDVQANNFSTANALVSGGNISAAFLGNITGTFGDFDGNVYADWFVGNIEANNANFSELVFVNSDLTVIGNLIATGNVISRKITSPVGDLHFSAATDNPNNIIRFDSVSAFDIPSGNTLQRPPDPNYGYVRYNVDLGSIEWWSGMDWISATNSITGQIINPDGINPTYTLDQSTSATAILVNINGTVQQAGTAYTVNGDQITFAETPLTTDIIEIRFLSGGVALSAPFDGGLVTGNVTILPTTESTSTITGALTVAGGAGVAGNLNIGGNIGITATTGTPSNTATPADWLKVSVSGSTYFIPLYQ